MYSMIRVPFGMSVSANTPLPWMPERRTMMRRPDFAMVLAMSLLNFGTRRGAGRRIGNSVPSASSSRHPRNAHCNLRREKIEVATAVGLLHRIEKELAITALVVRAALQAPAIACAAQRARLRRRAARACAAERRAVCESPLRTSASGPPTADSGVTCRTMAPNAVPLIRASEMRTMSFTPCRASFRGIGM